MIITIDGPAAAGKTSTAKALAGDFQLLYLDTGALYRAVAVMANAYGISAESPTDEQLGKLNSLIPRTIHAQRGDNGVMQVFIDKTDVTDQLRTPLIDQTSSKISVFPAVRAAVHVLERRIGGSQALIAEGRDTGSVGFPDANLKIYLTADLHQRALRRWLMRGRVDELEQVEKDLTVRDERDMNRTEAPLIAPPGAYYIDNTNLTLKQTVTLVSLLAKTKM